MARSLKSVLTNAIDTLRWLVALWLDRYPETCWASLAAWASGRMGWRDLWEVIWDQPCTEEDGAYCGKCVETGRLVK